MAPPDLTTPDPEAIRSARKRAELTQAQAAGLIGAGVRTWEDWEAGRRNMPPAKWHFFLSHLPRVRR